MELTKSELEVMNVIWQAKEPLSRNDIIARSPEHRSWKDSSIHIILNGLLRKEAIKEDGFVKCNKIYARKFSPLISGEEYYAKTMFSGGKETVPMLFSALIRSDQMTPELLAELETMLAKRKSELGSETND